MILFTGEGQFHFFWHFLDPTDIRQLQTTNRNGTWGHSARVSRKSVWHVHTQPCSHPLTASSGWLGLAIGGYPLLLLLLLRVLCPLPSPYSPPSF